MKNLSYWALMNPVKSITIIVICQIILSIIAVYSGIWLFAQDVAIPEPVYYIGMTLFFAAFALYPIRRARYKFWKYNFVKQKSLDALTILSYMAIAVSISNMDANAAWQSNENAPELRQIVQKTEQNMAPEQKTWSRKEIRKALRHEYKQYVTEMKAKARAEGGVYKSAKIAGVIFLTILLMLLFTVLACSVACSGSGAAGLFVLVGGWALAIAICVSALRSINGKSKSKYEPMPEGDGT